MAITFLDSTDTNYHVISPASIYGSDLATDKVLVDANATGIKIMSSVERVDVPGASSAFTYLQAGGHLYIYSGSTLAADVLLQSDTDGTQIVFTNGSAFAKLNADNTMSIGGALVPTGTAAAVTPAVDATITSGSSTTSTTPGGTGQVFTLTANATPDILSLTSGNDTVTGAAGTLAATDVVVDATATDSDIMNLSMNSYASTTATITNIETLNIAGVYTSAGIDLANVSGTKTINLSAGIAGGTGTVAGATAAKVATGIVAGTNIGTLNVNTTPITTGTGGNVNIDRGSATTATIGATGATGNNTYTVNAAANQTTVLSGGSAGTDTFTLNLTGGASTLTITNAAAPTGDINVLNINSNTAANVVTLSSATHEVAGNASTDAINIGGSQALTFIGDGDVIGGSSARTAATQGEAITKATGAGTLTFTNVAALGNPTFFNRALLDVLNITTVAANADITINENTTLQLSVANGTQSYDVDNNNLTTGLAAGAGTLKVNLTGTTAANAIQTSFKTGVNVGTSVWTNSTIDSTITTLDTATTATTVDTVVVGGSKNMTIGTWTATGGEVLTAANLTGNLTATIGATGATVQGGSGNDTITGGAAADSVGGAAGNDVLSGGTGAINDTMTGGLGNDTFIITGTGSDTITDFSFSGTNGTDIIGVSVGTAGIAALNDGNSAAVKAGTTAKIKLVTAATTLAAGDNIIAISGTFTSAALMEAAIEATGSRQLTFSTALVANEDIVVAWTDGTNGHVGFYTNAVGATTLGADGTYTELVTLTGVTSVDALASANFQFVV